MCKVAIFPHIPYKSRKGAIKLARALTKPMTARDNDAFGVAAVDASPELYAGRWLPKYAWRAAESGRPVRAVGGLTLPWSNLIDTDATKLTAEQAMIDAARADLPAQPTAMLLHARWATHGKGLINAHPHVSPDRTFALIHNGVVQTYKLDLRRSQCDSEGILNALTDSRFGDKPAELQTVADRLRGYYALGCLVYVQDRWYCDIIRDSSASLSAGYVRELGLWVYVTEASQLKAAAKAIGATVTRVVKVADNSHVRIDCLTGQEVFAQRFNPAPRYESYGGYAGGEWSGDAYAGWERHHGVKTASVETSSKATVAAMQTRSERSTAAYERWRARRDAQLAEGKAYTVGKGGELIIRPEDADIFPREVDVKV